ncbi:unnamed protein product [Cyprideis torosa]|uniref:Uncharacterized protein n=1 Tax=Cyprideis torosa TaxID=163714 RepID=A0A7R8ZUK7_9CRUS|nr:unnamed protein product [Cyprideis torosa]CAG0900901.1 unnamed protein product [Cyprideis torosa]
MPSHSLIPPSFPHALRHAFPFAAIDLMTRKKVAVKLETTANKKAGHLEREFKTYQLIQGGPGMPNAYHLGPYTTQYTALVMELLGPSLKMLHEENDSRFSPSTVANIAIQLLDRFEDVKPDNFLIGRGRKAILVHVIDFGLAKYYWDVAADKPFPFRETTSITGTVRYMSINSHMGVEQSRRDDLQALGYMFMFLLKGTLPWQGLKFAETREKYERIMERKMAVSPEELCYGHHPEFASFLKYTRSLSFYDAPDYNYMRGLFQVPLYTKHNIGAAAPSDVRHKVFAHRTAQALQSKPTRYQ